MTTESPRLTVAARLRQSLNLRTSREVAEALNIDPSTLRSWIASGEIPYIRIAGFLRFDPITVADWLEAHSATGQEVA